MNYSAIRLGDHCELITKGTTPTSVGLAFCDQGVPFLRVGNISGGSVNYLADTLFIDEQADRVLKRSRILPGDVLLSIAGTIGRSGVVPACAPPMNCNQAVAIIRTRDSIDRQYLRHWLESRQAQAQMAGATVTGTIQNLSLTQVGELKVPLPPLPEQRRIAAILDQADAIGAKRREALTQLDGLTQSIFIEMFGDPATNPRGWPEVTIADLCEVKGGKRLPKGEDYSATSTPFRYIRVTDIRSGEVDESKLAYLKPEVQKTISRYVVSAGDVIISIAGSIGLIAPVSSSLAGANLTENAAKLVPRSGVLAYDHVFLARALQTPFVQGQISSHVGQATIGKLALFRIEKVRLPLPPIDAQRKFAECVGTVARLRQSHQLCIEELESLLASLQHRAFTGQLS